MGQHTPSKRIWIIEPDETGLPNEREVFDTLADMGTILTRIGGVISAVAERRQIAPEVYAPTRYVFRWESFVPTARPPAATAATPEPEPLASVAELLETDPEPEPVAAGG